MLQSIIVTVVSVYKIIQTSSYPFQQTRIHWLHLQHCCLAGDRLEEPPFHIDHKSGIIKLIGDLDKRRVSYHLNITAVDDGSCCGGHKPRRSQGLVVIEVKDVNNNAPRFLNCNTYQPTVAENQDVGTSVTRVWSMGLTSLIDLLSLKHWKLHLADLRVLGTK